MPTFGPYHNPGPLLGLRFGFLNLGLHRRGRPFSGAGSRLLHGAVAAALCGAFTQPQPKG